MSEKQEKKAQADRLNLTESARLLGVHTETLRRWLDEKRIPHTRLSSRKVHINREDLEAFIAAARVEAAS